MLFVSRMGRFHFGYIFSLPSSWILQIRPNRAIKWFMIRLYIFVLTSFPGTSALKIPVRHNNHRAHPMPPGSSNPISTSICWSRLSLLQFSRSAPRAWRREVDHIFWPFEKFLPSSVLHQQLNHFPSFLSHFHKFSPRILSLHLRKSMNGNRKNRDWIPSRIWIHESPLEKKLKGG